MIYIEHAENFLSNFDSCRAGEDPCIICGKGVKHTSKVAWVRAHNGTMSCIVTDEEADALNAAGKSGADMGGWPIGAGCLKQHPELKPYLNGGCR